MSNRECSTNMANYADRDEEQNYITACRSKNLKFTSTAHFLTDVIMHQRATIGPHTAERTSTGLSHSWIFAHSTSVEVN